MGVLFSSCFGHSDTWDFPSGRSVSVVRELGEGGFSFVYLVKDRNGTQFALKKVLLQLPEQVKAFESEVAAHAAFDGSRHVVQLIDSCVVGARSRQEGLLLLEYCKDGTIQDLVENRGPMSERHALRVFAQICESLVEFHSKKPPLAHRDLKPANVLRGPHGTAVLMDLGSVAEADVLISDRRQALKLQEKCAEHCTAPYRAPELFEVPTDTYITSATDIWSLGCVLFFMLTGRPAFDGSAMATISGRYAFPQDMDQFISDTGKNLVAKCLQPDAQLRPTAQQLLDYVRAQGV